MWVTKKVKPECSGNCLLMSLFIVTSKSQIKERKPETEETFLNLLKYEMNSNTGHLFRKLYLTVLYPNILVGLRYFMLVLRPLTLLKILKTSEEGIHLSSI